jgi:hypothetical protein
LLTHLPPAASASLRQQESLLLNGDKTNDATNGIKMDASLPNIPLQRLQSSSAFQTDVRQFQEDLRAGKLEPAWIEMAMNASARRRAGEFDSWKEREREMVWGISTDPDVEGVGSPKGTVGGPTAAVESPEGTGGDGGEMEMEVS